MKNSFVTQLIIAIFSLFLMSNCTQKSRNTTKPPSSPPVVTTTQETNDKKTPPVPNPSSTDLPKVGGETKENPITENNFEMDYSHLQALQSKLKDFGLLFHLNIESDDNSDKLVVSASWDEYFLSEFIKNNTKINIEQKAIALKEYLVFAQIYLGKYHHEFWAKDEDNNVYKHQPLAEESVAFLESKIKLTEQLLQEIN